MRSSHCEVQRVVLEERHRSIRGHVTVRHQLAGIHMRNNPRTSFLVDSSPSGPLAEKFVELLPIAPVLCMHPSFAEQCAALWHGQHDRGDASLMTYAVKLLHVPSNVSWFMPPPDIIRPSHDDDQIERPCLLQRPPQTDSSAANCISGMICVHLLHHFLAFVTRQPVHPYVCHHFRQQAPGQRQGIRAELVSTVEEACCQAVTESQDALDIAHFHALPPHIW
mmetsp:Transcript_49112/g.116937  ORF Transcript_49112/g.116937 Transcript_49112/m.116937 type:complete len:222 (+) Transcript_49112:142-807(+)